MDKLSKSPGFKKIFVIDDEEDLCFLLKVNLEETGSFKVFTCSRNTEAVAQVKKVLPDLIISDILMPEISGPEIAKEVRANKRTKDIPIIFLTSILREEEAEECKAVGKEHYVAKPVEVDELVKKIKKIIDLP